MLAVGYDKSKKINKNMGNGSFFLIFILIIIKFGSFDFKLFFKERFA
jgi:hypothetical protein